MENKIIAGIVGVAICIILAAGVLVPAVINAADTVEPTTKYNIGTKQTFKEMTADDVFTLDCVYSGSGRTDTWKLNGETILNENLSVLAWNWAIVSDSFFVQAFAPSNSNSATVNSITTDGSTNAGMGTLYYLGADASHPVRNYTWEFTDEDTITFTAITTNSDDSTSTFTKTYDVSWCYVACTIDDGAYLSAQVTTSEYYDLLNRKDVILAGNYTTGALDTGYYYKDGQLTILNTSYTGTVNFTQSLSSGTTDIYDTTVSVSVTDGNDTESFSPYRALVPYEVHGHASGGAMYTLINVIPIFVIIAILLAAAAFFVSRRSY